MRHHGKAQMKGNSCITQVRENMDSQFADLQGLLFKYRSPLDYLQPVKADAK